MDRMLGRSLGWVRKEIWLLLVLASLAVILGAHDWVHSLVLSPWGTALLLAWLFLVILCAASGVVRRAEALALIYGEPWGTLILTLSAVGVEVIMVSFMMLRAQNNPTMARDTVYSTLMLIFNGQIGLAMLLGGMKYGEQHYNLKGSNAFFSMILAITGLSLYLPLAIPPEKHEDLEIFLLIATLALYMLFLWLQTHEHRYFFAPEPSAGQESEASEGGWRAGLRNGTALAFSLAAAAILSEALAGVLDNTVETYGFSSSWASLVVAVLILAPEGLTAIRAGLHNEMQRVVNISMGSALSTVGLTIPAILVVSMISGRDVVLGLDPSKAVMLLLTLLLATRSYGVVETNILQGMIHFVLFVAFVFTIMF